MTGDIRNAQGDKLDYTFHAGKENSQSLAIIGHGVTGNKDRPFVVALAEALAAAGINTLRFSFAGNGESEGRFEDCTISKEVGDLKAVLDATSPTYNKQAYIGHSMGGAVGVITAAQDDRLAALVSLAGMVTVSRFAEVEFGEEKSGFMWEEEDCPLSQGYLDDCAKLGDLSPLGAKITAPWLLVHGVPDDVVPIADSRSIFAVANLPKQLVELEKANHVFADDAMQPMLDAVVPFVAGKLG